MKSLIFFDYRPLYGENSLADALRDHIDATLRLQNVFFAIMARTVVQHRPPLGFFGTLVVDKGGEHKDQLNLKINGLGPVINIARLLSLEKGVRETSTIERLQALRDRHGIIKEFGPELEHAFEFLTLLRLHHQRGQVESGLTVDNFINPDRLTNLEKKTMKDAFKVISRVQDLITEEYRAGMVGGL